MAEELRQRELDREAAKEEKQQDREDRMQSNLLLAGVLSRILPGSSELVSMPRPRRIKIQYEPDDGSQPLPMMFTLTTLSSLLRLKAIYVKGIITKDFFRDLKEYTQVSNVSGIVWEDGEMETTVLVSDIDHMKFNKASIAKVVVVKKGSNSYFKLSN